MKRAEAYLRAVRRGLADAPPEDRDRLMKRLREAVTAYLEEDPEAGESDIVKAFGTPEDCAAELLSECDPARVAAVRRKRRLYIAVAALVIALVIAAAVLRFRGGAEVPLTSNSFSHHFGHGAGHH